jgi:hypothetical protein
VIGVEAQDAVHASAKSGVGIEDILEPLAGQFYLVLLPLLSLAQWRYNNWPPFVLVKLISSTLLTHQGMWIFLMKSRVHCLLVKVHYN